ncbi:ABC transporter permease [Aeromicrobium sp. PE09-221]|uniref:ABC transporter permease n=1 Tax=Aeromicrobium sp. PE09-221 TaxID=1898043 RepID=UPI000B3EC714|nr:ABC transporter permease [Aeromicrobium sp. PE09-221]OUZ12583.1 ABC transporter permease [Aeromicrobium sp. PE09-221]
MFYWIARRLAAIGATLVVLSFVVFALLYLAPGRPEEVLLGTRPATPETLAAIRAKYHLDEPFLAQYLHWAGDALRLQFGESIQSGQAVTAVIGERLPITIMLAAYAVALVVVVAVPSGLLAGARPGSRFDRAATMVSTFGFGAPAFVIGIVMLYVFGIVLGWFPVYGGGSDDLLDRLHHLTLPALALTVSVAAIVFRQTRAATMSVTHADYMTFASTRGLPRRLVWGRYRLRNSSLPVITSVGAIVAFFLTGAVVVEQVFSLPGIGSQLVGAVNTKDVPVIQALALLMAAFILLINLICDVVYLLVDPRLRKAMVA